VTVPDSPVILHFCGSSKEVVALKADLNKIKGVKAKTMTV